MGRLYEACYNTLNNPAEVSKRVHEIYAGGAVKKFSAIFEYVLGGCIDTKKLEIRIFEESTNRLYIPGRQMKENRTENQRYLPI